ncbi:MAG: cation:proton antiporter, partial [Candidatus Brocadiales bacterium]
IQGLRARGHEVRDMNGFAVPLAIGNYGIPMGPPSPAVQESEETTRIEGAGYMAEGYGVEGQTGGVLELPAIGLEDVKAGSSLWHTDPANSVLLAIVIIIAAAKIGEEGAKRLGLPQVVGELVMGIILGNMYFFSGWDFFNFLHEMPFLKIMSEIGVIVLLLMVGVNTDLKAMLRVGLSAFLVAFGGVMMPAGLGYLISYFLLPDASLHARLFLVASLCATSVAIKLKVFHELGKLQTTEAKIVIGAAVVDDALVLLILAAISGIAITGQFSAGGIAVTATVAVAFLSALGVVSLRYGESFGNLVTRKCPEGIKIFIIVVVCLGLAFLAEFIGLATIVGAFNAGLFLRYVKAKTLMGKERSMEELIWPAYLVVVPIFFVLVGAQVRLESFMDRDAVVLGLSITGAAILGKLFCSVCVVERGVNRLAIGIAMIPRLEVALIIASVGRGLGVLGDTLFSAVTVMVAITAIMSPPLLKLVLTRAKEFAPVRPLVPYYLSDESRRELLRSRQLGRR